MGEFRIDFRGNVLLTISEIDNGNQIKITTMENENNAMWINKSEAIQMINHLQEQFKLNQTS